MNTNNVPPTFEITVVSLPDRDNLVAEIYYERKQWAEIYQETSQMRVQFYESYDQDCWDFSLNDAIEILKIARCKLLDLDK